MGLKPRALLRILFSNVPPPTSQNQMQFLRAWNYSYVSKTRVLTTRSSWVARNNGWNVLRKKIQHNILNPLNRLNYKTLALEPHYLWLNPDSATYKIIVDSDGFHLSFFQSPFSAPFCTAENVELKTIFLILPFSKTPAVTEVPPIRFQLGSRKRGDGPHCTCFGSEGWAGILWLRWQ